MSAVYDAARAGKADVVKHLCASKASPNETTLGPSKSTALHAAVYYGHADVVKVLLKAKADPALKNAMLLTPIDEAKIVENPVITKLLAKYQGQASKAGSANKKAKGCKKAKDNPSEAKDSESKQEPQNDESKSKQEPEKDAKNSATEKAVKTTSSKAAPDPQGAEKRELEEDDAAVGPVAKKGKASHTSSEAEKTSTEKDQAEESPAMGDLDAPEPGGADDHGVDDHDEDVDAVLVHEDQCKTLTNAFAGIIGQTKLKKQIRTFYNCARMDMERSKLGGDKAETRPLHMIFYGPPGTGKSTMATLVADLLGEIGIWRGGVHVVKDALSSLQKPKNVDDVVEEAGGGVLMIDEAYTLKQRKNVINSLMNKMLDPPQCVVILAGYRDKMKDFLKVNPGLPSRFHYRFDFMPYNGAELFKIFQKKLTNPKGTQCTPDAATLVKEWLAALPGHWTSKENGRLVSHVITGAMEARDDRIMEHGLELSPGKTKPSLLAASVCTREDFERSFRRLEERLEEDWGPRMT